MHSQFYIPSHSESKVSLTPETAPPAWSWISMSGPDSLDFLHRLTTVNTKNLSLGFGQNGCFLTPQGKIRAYFTLWNCGADYGFELDAGKDYRWKNELLSAIDQYTFSEKLTVKDLTATQDSAWIFPDPAELQAILPESSLAASTSPFTFEKEGARVCYQGTSNFGRPWLTIWGKKGELPTWLKTQFPHATSVAFAEIEKWRILSLRPRVDAEITENTIPLEVGLIDSISENKGCYPGQEVIEKIISLGSPSKRLVRIKFKGSRTPQVGDSILTVSDTPAEICQITSMTSENPGEFSVLGIVKRIHAKSGLAVQLQKTSSENQLQGEIVKVSS